MGFMGLEVTGRDAPLAGSSSLGAMNPAHPTAWRRGRYLAAVNRLGNHIKINYP